MNRILITIAVLLLGINVFAQPPQKMSYQMVVRNSSNAVVANQGVGIRVSVLQGSASGSLVFSETHIATTNANGLASFVIGAGAPVTGTFAGVDWANGPYFLKTEVDPTGGSTYTITGTSQLLSVPYALYAGAIASQTKTHVIISGYINNSEAAAKLAAEVGANTEFVWIQNTHGLTSINLTGLNKVIDVVIKNNQDLQTVTAPSLTKVENEIYISSNPVLTSMSAPVLKTVINLRIDNCIPLTTLSMPGLTKIGGDFQLSYSGPLPLSFPLLDTVANIIFDHTVFSSINLPSLKIADSLSLKFNTFQSNFSLPLFSARTINSISNFGIGSIVFPNLLQIGKSLILMSSNSPSFSFPTLQQVGWDLRIEQNFITNVSFPSLQKVSNYISINGTSLDSLSLPALTSVNYLDVSNNSRLLSISFAQLKRPTLFSVNGNDSLQSIFTPLLDTITTLKILNDASLTSLAFPSLRAVTSSFVVNKNRNLASISFPLWNSFGTSNSSAFVIDLAANGFNSSAVNSILNYLVNIIPTFTNKGIGLRQWPVAAPPTGQGLIDKATLISRGNAVDTN